MAKYIKLSMENGEIYGIALKYIAKHRANYYESPLTEAWKKEVDYVMTDSYEGIDWLQNNMNWEDIKDIVFTLETPKQDYNYLFRNAECDMIEM